MPPATEPIPWRILEEMQTRLALPDAGADYFYDFNVVKLGQDIAQASIFPAVTIGIGELGRMYEVKEGRVLWAENVHWALSVICMIDGYVDAPKRLARVLHDVHRALMSGNDPTWGGLVRHVGFTGAEMYPPLENDTRSMIEVGVDVHFKTKDTTMLVAT